MTDDPPSTHVVTHPGSNMVLLTASTTAPRRCACALGFEGVAQVGRGDLTCRHLGQFSPEAHDGGRRGGKTLCAQMPRRCGRP